MKDQLNILMNAVEATAPYGQHISPLQRRSFHIACIDLGEFMERARKKAGFSATGFANFLGVTLPHYRDMEKGNRRFLPIHIRALRKDRLFEKVLKQKEAA